MRIIFFIISIAFSCFNTSFSQTAVFLKGTACAGKTSICAQLKARGWRVVDEDGLLLAYSVQYWQELCPDEMCVIAHAINEKNIFHAIKSNLILFKDGVSYEDQQVALDAVQQVRDVLCGVDRHIFKDWLKQHVLQLTHQYIQQGYNVVVDAWFDIEDLRDVLQTVYLQVVLVYCPLDKLLQRLEIRNKRAWEQRDLRNYRFLYMLMSSFTGLYDIREDSEKAVGEVLSSNIKKVCEKDVYELSTINLHVVPQSERVARWSEWTYEQCERLLKKNFLDKCTAPQLYITPCLPYDYIVYTDEQTPYECAVEIATRFGE